MGPSDEDINYAFTARNKQVSQSGFWMDATEITNNEYRQFTMWVRDSLAAMLMGAPYTKDVDGVQRVDWTKVKTIKWNDKAAIEKIASCDKVPQQTRDALKQAYDTSSGAWASVPAEGKAALATQNNLKKFEERRAEFEKLAADSLTSAKSRAKQLDGFTLNLQAKAGTEGKLFGSVGTSDISEALTKGGIAIERAEVRLPGGPIRHIGEHKVKLHLHSDVEIDLPVVISAED